MGETVPSTSSALLTTASMTASNGLVRARSELACWLLFPHGAKWAPPARCQPRAVLFPTATALVMRSTSPTMTPAATRCSASMISTATHSPFTSSKTCPSGAPPRNNTASRAPKTRLAADVTAAEVQAVRLHESSVGVVLLDPVAREPRHRHGRSVVGPVLTWPSISGTFDARAPRRGRDAT